MPRARAALAALLVLAAAGASRAAVPPEGRAEGDGAPQRLESLLPRRCGVCHLDKAPPAPPGVIAFAPPRGSAAVGSSGMCYSCHDGLVLDGRRDLWTGRHHPSAGGGVECGSCHTPHVRARGVGAFMRFESGNYRWCSSCHGGRRPGRAGEHPAVRGEEGAGFDCGSCHVVHRAPGAGLIRGESAEALCVGCHGGNPSRKDRGGALSHPVGGKGPGCLDCHRVHGGGQSMLTKAAGDGRLCRQCHERSFPDADGNGGHPLGDAGASCFACHRMHNVPGGGRGRGGLLAASRGELDALCARCHEDRAGSGPKAWNHPVGVKGGEHGIVDGERLGRAGALFGAGGKLSCLSCHAAHGGVAGTPQLLAPKQAICLFCHPRQNALDPERAAYGAHPVAVRPRRARIAGVFRTAGEVGPGGELICATCHRAHDAKPGTPGLVVARDTYSCLLCHTEEAAVAPTAHSTARAPGAGEKRAVGVCAGCHGEHGWRIAVPPPAGEEDRSTVVERLCGVCHGVPEGAPYGGVTNHPINVPMPQGALTGGMPLFWSDGRRLRTGVVSCPTCHDVHRSGPSGRFLRPGAFGGDLCLGCHREQETVIGTRHDLGPTTGSTCDTCHPVHEPTPTLTWPSLRADIPVENIDLSWFCGGCHRAGGPAEEAVVAERAHPSIVLPQGAEGAKPIGCAGCHDPHRWNPADPMDRGREADAGPATGFLRRPAAGAGGLCEGCHPQQTGVAATPHDFSGRESLPEGLADPARSGVCAPCHLVHGGSPLFLLSPSFAEEGGGRVEPCEGCHKDGGMTAGTGDRSHPVGGSPGIDAGADLPLYGPTGRRQVAGRMACATCHEPHRLAPAGGSGADTPAARSFLRLGADGFAPLCFPCHAEHAMVVGTDHDLRVTAPDALNAEGRRPSSSGVCGACHAVHRAPEDFVLWNRSLGEGPDLNSRACTSCHRRGDATGARVPPRLALHEVKNPGSPPVPRIFTITRTSSGGAPPIPLYMADGTRDEQGYLSCASCHDAHRWETDVMSSGGGVPREGDLTNSFLRVRSTQVADRTICRECHPHNAMELYRTFHFPEGN